MKLIIFAGGTGTRLWPLSRQNSPKQFEKLRDDKSTLQLAVDRIESFGIHNVFISTNENYLQLVKDQVPDLPSDNILTEPAKRDLAAAVCLTLLRLKQTGTKGTVAMLWSDHFMDRPEEFRQALEKADLLVQEKSDRLIFLGERPRFANHNLGWIHLGNQIKDNVHTFIEWKYRPELLECQEMFESGEWFWNPGYFVFDIDFILGLYKIHMPEMYKAIENMLGDEEKMKIEYAQLEAVSFDEAIVEKVSPEQAVVLKVDLGWSDPGTLYALKEVLEPDTEKNFTEGLVLEQHMTDSFIYNEERDKLVSAVGLDGMVIVNTKDALLVCHKDKVPEIKELLKKVKNEGLEKYL